MDVLVPVTEAGRYLLPPGWYIVASVTAYRAPDDQQLTNTYRPGCTYQGQVLTLVQA